MNSNIVLLTGATGFVGKKVLHVLSKRGIRVRIVTRDKRSLKPDLVDTVESVVKTADLFAESAEWWEQICQDIDTIIHIAWFTEPGKYLLSSKNLDCLSGTLQMAKGAALAKVRRFVGMGTCFEYDLTGGMLSVDTPLRPTTPYAGAKASAFMALSQWLPSQNVQFAWCRLFYLHGDGEDNRRFVPYLRAKMLAGEPAKLTSGNQIRDYLEVEEAARMIVETALSKKHGAINICSGVPITIRQFAEKIADDYGRRDLLAFGAHPENLVDPICVVGVK